MNISIEKLTYEEVSDFFYRTRFDFQTFKDNQWRNERAIKLSRFASFVTCRNDDGRIVGMIACYRNQPPLCYITHVCVEEAYKHQGVFGKIYQCLETDLKHTDFTRIRLEVRHNNTKAINAYMKFGFEIKETKIVGNKTHSKSETPEYQGIIGGGERIAVLEKTIRKYENRS